MASNSLKLVFLFILVSFFNFQTPEAEEVTYFEHYCYENKTTANNIFQAKVMTLLTSLSSNATVRNFYNDTVSDRNASNAVYGLFMCRGDVPSQLCRQCVLNATQKLSSECYLSTEAIVWYDECMVRYSKSSFFSTMETAPAVAFWTTANVFNQAGFGSLLRHTLNETAYEAAFSPVGDRYATKEAKVSENHTLFCLAQCTLDISPKDCRECVTSVKGSRIMLPERKLGWKYFSTSCAVRYELYPFYRFNAPGQGGLLPATKHLETDSIYPLDYGYLSHNCLRSDDYYDSLHQEIVTLFFYLSSNATSSSNSRFYKADVGSTVFGLFMCRGDIPPRLCGQCVANATVQIAAECPWSSEAIIWYNHCLLRYSNQPFFYRMSRSPKFDNLNVTKVNDLESSFRFSVLSNALAKVANETASSDEKYWTQSFILNDNQTLYVLAQCTQDLPYLECYSCLSDVIGSAIPWSRLGSVGGSVLYPSCTMRFELFQFYRIGTENHAPPPLIHSPVVLPPPTEKKGSPHVVILIVVSIIVSMILLSSCYYLLRRKAKKSYKHILKENFGHESTTVESLQFDLTIIEAATNNFSPYNRIGKGGFGEVYKGVLHDGRHIVVKRLSRSSTQGAVEFKNEVLLIAKLQHRNLVAFIGFCLQEQEKILIYEYVPNKSLDYFLFGAHLEKLLSWSERHNIIGGIARGILYLHEYSRLKVIHRDLKPSNILLDENMNPKISDFGLAKIVEIDQQQGSTNKIVGTWSYVSPEYAMLGQFSEKSDVFSFGVMILEIITGKKNIGSYESHHIADGLLSLVSEIIKQCFPFTVHVLCKR